MTYHYGSRVPLEGKIKGTNGFLPLCAGTPKMTSDTSGKSYELEPPDDDAGGGRAVAR